LYAGGLGGGARAVEHLDDVAFLGSRVVAERVDLVGEIVHFLDCHGRAGLDFGEPLGRLAGGRVPADRSHRGLFDEADEVALVDAGGARFGGLRKRLSHLQSVFDRYPAQLSLQRSKFLGRGPIDLLEHFRPGLVLVDHRARAAAHGPVGEIASAERSDHTGRTAHHGGDTAARRATGAVVTARSAALLGGAPGACDRAFGLVGRCRQFVHVALETIRPAHAAERRRLAADVAQVSVGLAGGGGDVENVALDLVGAAGAAERAGRALDAGEVARGLLGSTRELVDQLEPQRDVERRHRVLARMRAIRPQVSS